VPEGALPYRDLYDTKPPLFLYWLALARVVPDEFPRALFWLEGAWLGLTFVSVFALVARRLGRMAGMAAAGLLGWTVWSPGLGGFWSRVQAEEILALPMAASAFCALRAARSRRWAFVTGLLAGICGLMKVPALAITGAWAAFWCTRLPLSIASARIGALGLGVLVPWSGAAMWFMLHGETARFFDAVFRDQTVYAKLLRRPVLEILSAFTQKLLSAAALACVAAAFGLFALFRRKAPEALWLTAWLVACVLAVVLQRQIADYHLLLLALPLAIAGGHGIAAAGRSVRSQRGRASGVALLVACGVLAARDAANAWEAYGPGVAHWAGRTSRPRYLREVQRSYAAVYEEEAARRIRERTLPSERILVWAWHPGLYVLADRRPSTRYPFHRILLTNAPLSAATPGLSTRRAELAAELMTDAPRYVVVGHGDRTYFEPQDSNESLADFPALAALLERDYAVDHRVGRLTLYRRLR